jgi:hypothetical protein
MDAPDTIVPLAGSLTLEIRSKMLDPALNMVRPEFASLTGAAVSKTLDTGEHWSGLRFGSLIPPICRIEDAAFSSVDFYPQKVYDLSESIKRCFASASPRFACERPRFFKAEAVFEVMQYDRF